MTISPDFVLSQLRVVGILMALLVVVNMVVPRQLNWREEMRLLSLLNRQIFQVHSIFIVLTLALFSALLLTSGDALLEPTRLSRAVLIGLTIFWSVRMVMQWSFYSPEIWRGDRFRTVMHYLFSAAWIYITTVFVMALWINWSGAR